MDITTINSAALREYCAAINATSVALVEARNEIEKWDIDGAIVYLDNAGQVWPVDSSDTADIAAIIARFNGVSPLYYPGTDIEVEVGDGIIMGDDEDRDVGEVVAIDGADITIAFGEGDLSAWTVSFLHDFRVFDTLYEAHEARDEEIEDEAIAALGEDPVLVEYMPMQHRASHRAAGNSGSYPHNGAIRFVLPAAVMEDIEEDEWVSVIRTATPNDFRHYERRTEFPWGL